MNSIELSIIIVNFNGKKYLEDCFNSIYKQTFGINIEVIVFDNNSSDDSVRYIKKNYPKINLIESKENLGFAKGNNKAVVQSKGKNILLLNNDTVLLDHIKPVLDLLNNDDNGAIGIKMLNGDKQYTVSVGKFPKPHQLIKFSLLNEKREEFLNDNFKNQPYLVDWVTGAFLLTKRSLWEKVNGLDEDYFMYVEDVDFCKKISNEGKKILFLPNISFVHYVGFNPKREVRLINGYKIYSKKHFSFINAILANTSLSINYVYKKVFKNIC